ncbi:hypothetical protein M8542_14365 [Amycolatopsis sp. OK19-0408]|uniref:Deoxyribonuclease NucA/NucB domain-containing protein n=1 Tax=Amycolatopsis iheyensis TaxID=2945988 RepID=A0A9X2NG59_9PSEU|nr:hypothetical protein [Amycolatopsis iheyensis]MCR6484005.1 hypothetical protein [Amycolatopsis iheyensis]
MLRKIMVRVGAVAAAAVTVVAGFAPAASADDQPAVRPSTAQFQQLAAQASQNTCAGLAPSFTGRCVATKPLTKATNFTASVTSAGKSAVMTTGATGARVNAEPQCPGFWRANSCMGLNWGYIVYEVINGVPGKQIGSEDLYFDTRVGWNWNSLNWSLRTSVKVTNATGTELPGATGVMSNGCARDTLVCDPGGASYAVKLLTGVTESQGWEQRETGVVSQGTGNYVNLSGYVGPWLVVTPAGAPASKVSMNASEYNGVVGRCDRIVRKSPGCVAAENPADIAYDATIYPKVAEVAQHVYDAEGSLAPHYGWYGVGQPLTLGNDATEAANRNVACPSGGTPPGKSCDEYPIARSREGAASGGPYSVEYVIPEANSSQGAQTANYIGYCRIMEQEAFWVIAFLPDGRNSWDR